MYFTALKILFIEMFNFYFLFFIAEHENHEFVATIGSDLLDAMIKKKGLKGFEVMITKACGNGKRSSVSGRFWFCYPEAILHV